MRKVVNMPAALRPELGGKSPMVGVRLPADAHERMIKLAGSDRGAVSAFIRQAVLDAIEAAAELEPAG